MKHFPLFKSVLLTLFIVNFLFISSQEIMLDHKEGPLFVKWDKQVNESKHVLNLTCPNIDTVRIAVIGLGNRGQMALERLPKIPNVRIVAIADIDSAKVNKSITNYFEETPYNIPDAYFKADDWKLICDRKDIDLIYVCTHWELHTPIAVYAMEHDKHVAVEVPAALTIKECWQLVKTAEKTRKHCIQLENCMYDFFEITVLNMAQQGLLGEIVHTEGAYIHDLRELNFSSTYYWNYWRLRRLKTTDGNTYPTHGLGPLSHLLNIHRGDQFSYLVSMSTDQNGLTKYAKENFEPNSQWNTTNYKKGDMNTTMIRTRKGKTILLQHDVTSPRPYSRLFTVSGTKGFVQKYPVKSMAFEPNAHRSLSISDIKDTLLKYEPFPIKEIKDTAKEIGGHGGMDYIMDYRLIYCLRNGLPLDQDVYDAAEWSAIVELSKKSVQKGSKPMHIPDFTRGNSEVLSKVSYYLK